MDRTDPPAPHTPPTARPNIRLTGTEQSEHDALAELFLGDAPYAPAPMGSAQSARDDRPAAADQPIPPTPARPERPERGRFEGSAVRAERPDAHDTSEPGAERPVVELVILGHLPVRASLWVRQYACLSARKRSETVALVRSAGGSVSIDVITGRTAAQIEPVDSVEDGVTIATTAASRVVLRVDETAEPELLERAGIDEVTILTGADEAAVVASYRLIKTLVATLDDRLDPEAGPRVRVAVMGNPGPEIDAARQKITRACTAFLDRPVEILDASGRIDATGTVTVCRSDADDAATGVLDALLGAPDRPRRPTPTATTPAHPAGLRLTEHHQDEPADPQPGTVPAPAPEVVVLAGATNAPSEPPAEVRITRLREPLACLIEGLTPVEARCPAAPGVELACDASGRLHAVCTDDRGAGEAVAALLAASAWARANLGLLIRAEPGIAIPSADPREYDDAYLHLLARRPSAARGVLDTDVTVYALAAVIAGGEEIMVATPLNDA
tara:strand:- start:1381 stop:2883 length:1503 start_codon:yes stop_codon:yes gene_type:complete